jgi:uncharacterized glyoxalase superfamily protein PhnB
MKKTILPLLLLAVLAAAAFRPTPAQEPTMTARRLTPVLIVDRVEPAAAWWRERLGFEQTMEVPHGDALGFVGLQQGNVEIMYQTRASVADDLPPLAQAEYRTVLFIEVDDLDAVERAMAGVEIVNPRRTAFYGMHELAVREPGGNVVIFAQRAEGAE